MINNELIRGLKAGFPICLGYFSVSFGFGIMSVQSGLSVLTTVIISLTNLTSAGQVAGVGVIVSAGSYLEMILTELLINARYMLMALSLGQNLSPDFTQGKRMAASYGITDEIFGIASTENRPLQPSYMAGMIFIATFGWVSGTFLGAVCGNILPEILTSALGILLYGMFIAIIIPPVKKDPANLILIMISGTISCFIRYCLPMITSGFALIISSVIAALILAIAKPIPDKKEE